ncbi:MAG: acyl-CoA carboxylase subunit beta, partial [Planctomycetales bacterium]|nr:acyl-CoA carboxylase subunit beta [Planctomycetales bacterium]
MSSSQSRSLEALSIAIAAEERTIREGGGRAASERQHAKGRLTARERIARLLDPGDEPLELGLWAGHGMYETWGGAPAAGVVAVIGRVAGRRHLIVANDATVKAGAF